MSNNYKYPASTFEANPTVNKLLVFPDGNCFVNKNDAETYAKQSRREYIEIERKDAGAVAAVEEKPEAEVAEASPEQSETQAPTETETKHKPSKNKKQK